MYSQSVMSTLPAAARLTAWMSLTRTKMLLANTSSMEMMLRARTALSPMKKSAESGCSRRARDMEAVSTHMREEEAWYVWSLMVSFKI